MFFTVWFLYCSEKSDYMNLWYCCRWYSCMDWPKKLKRIFKKMADQFGIKNDERQLSLIRSFHASLSPVLNYYKLNFKSCFGSWLVKLTCTDTNWTLFRSFTILLRSFFVVLRRFNGPSLFDKNVNFCCHFMLILQRKTTKRQLRKTSMAEATLARRNVQTLVSLRIVWNAWPKKYS